MKKKIWVIGSPGSGKSFFSKQLAKLLGHKNYCLDDFFWLPGWQKRELSSFKANVATLIKKERWIIEGVYSQIAEEVLHEVDAVVWFDPPLYTLLYRVFMRSLRHIWTGKDLCNGNRETIGNLLSKQSILLFLLRSHKNHRQEYENYCEYLRKFRPEVSVLRIKQWDQTTMRYLKGEL